jgi:hypothetical protein
MKICGRPLYEKDTVFYAFAHSLLQCRSLTLKLPNLFSYSRAVMDVQA